MWQPCELLYTCYAVEVREYCQWEWFNASCSSSSSSSADDAADHAADLRVIVMRSARYGRMRLSRCVREDHGALGCHADVLTQLHRRCTGRQLCSVRVPDPSLHDRSSCPAELMPYLETSYVCVTGTDGEAPCGLGGGVE